MTRRAKGMVTRISGEGLEAAALRRLLAKGSREESRRASANVSSISD